MAREPKVANVAVGAEDIAGLVEFAADKKVDLTIIGPKAPLVADHQLSSRIYRVYHG